MTFKTLFNTRCLRFVLHKYSPMIYRIIWRINGFQLLKVATSKEVFCYVDLFWCKRKWFLSGVLNTIAKEWFSNMKKYMQLMQALNAPTDTIFILKLKWRDLSFRDNKHLLNKTYIYIRSFEDMTQKPRCSYSNSFYNFFFCIFL